MKNSILKTSWVGVIFFAFSCADLDIASDGRLTMEQIFGNYRLTSNFANSCRHWVPGIGLSYGNNTPLASFCDEAHDAGDNTSGAVNDWYNNRTSPFSNPLTYTQDTWDHYFQGIRKCNVFLSSIADPELATAIISEDEKNGWIAEVRVLRAFYYLQLIKRYGGVPLIDDPYDLVHDFANDRRASFEACADFIIEQCDIALATPETEGRPIGFRWSIGDNEGGKLTRAFAHAVKSQTALFAASPLWTTPESKYTWTKAAEITKDALDQCLAHGFALYDTPIDPEIAQNPYAYYFIQRSDPSRSVDKETIYESSARSNVWRYAGTPVTEGAMKAGAGPSQELVDCYEMQVSGLPPILGYSDADHLQPIPNPAATDYDPANPYVGRDPRFYASIYYNGAPRSLSTKIEKDLFPMTLSTIAAQPLHDNMNNMNVTVEGDGSTHITVTGGDPYIYCNMLTEIMQSERPVRMLVFEYKSNRAATAKIYWCNPGPAENRTTEGISVPHATDWTRFEFDFTAAYNSFGFGKTVGDFFRFDIPNPDGAGNIGYEITIRDMKVEAVTPPPAAVPVETFLGGNCGISDRITDTRYTRTGYYLRKFNNYRSSATVDADGFMKLFRLGELYLNFAEAAYQAYGPETPVASTVAGSSPMTAHEAVNAIRARADMPPLPSLTKADFEKRYRNERRVELAFEEHRFFDVRRWKILHETDAFVTGMRITNEGGGVYTYNRFKLADRNTNSDKYLMYPIKQNEVAKMEAATGVLWQNPGWN
ncbi:MAG: RagB/SusD family nutrient uptake outer membrane protein [Bacteroidales bacterium]|jgi:hypothetical protein|nr:RagB/SusD family nutrient uptake outer membrane protein [Bacteroidales bacterium]